MGILWINLVAVFVFSFLARYFSTDVSEELSLTNHKPNKILVIAAFATLALVSGLRTNIGDTYVYRATYEFNDFTWEYILAEKDIGFGMLQMFLKTYVSEDPQVLIFTTAFITNALIVYTLYNYSRMIEISLFVYITGGLYLVSMNGVRQVLAASIAFVAIKYLINGNMAKYFLVVILASLFHQSALILLPFYFLARSRPWSKATIGLIIVSVIIVIGYDQFSRLLFMVLEGSQYEHYKDFSEGGANLIRVLVSSVPLILAYFGRDRLREIMPFSDYIINMSLVGLLFMVISTQNWIFARFSIYFELYHLILISWVIKLFSQREGRFIYYSTLICYLAYYYYENVINLNILYKSDFFGF